MKLSANSEFEGYEEFTRLRRQGVRPVVYLNGDDVTKDAIMADDQKGYVIVLVRDKDGKPMVRERSTVTKVKTGRVTISLPPVHEGVPTLADRSFLPQVLPFRPHLLGGRM